MCLKKKIYRTGKVLLLLLAGNSMNAQHIELTPFIGYETGAKMHTYNYGELRINDGMNWGGTLGVGPNSSMMFEFSYNHLRTNMKLDVIYDGKQSMDLDVDYYMFGAVKELRDGKATPYFSGALGWVNYRTLDKNIENEQKFTLDFAGGLKIKANERVGLKLQARLHLPMYFEGIYFTAGTGGLGMGLGATAFMVQGDFTGAIYFVIK
jgi:hypothetical protein